MAKPKGKGATKGVGVGDRYARARLLLAKRAGYLPEDFVIMPKGGQASQQWRAASKNLAADARRSGWDRPMLWLRESAAQGQGLLGPRKAQRTGLRGPGDERSPLPVNPGPLNILNNVAASPLEFGPTRGEPVFNFGEDTVQNEGNVDPRISLLMAMLMQGGKGGGY